VVNALLQTSESTILFVYAAPEAIFYDARQQISSYKTYRVQIKKTRSMNTLKRPPDFSQA
jgi:hypothetical protein